MLLDISVRRVHDCALRGRIRALRERQTCRKVGTQSHGPPIRRRPGCRTEGEMMRSLTYHRSNRTAITAMTIALAMVVVGLFYVVRSAEAHHKAGHHKGGTTPPPTLACNKGEFLAQYRNELMTFATQPVLTRCETGINNDWASDSPGSGVNADSFTARWVGTFDFEASGYEFTATSDDGIRLWVDGQLLIDQWKDQAAATYKATKAMTAGEHEVKVEYYENAGLAVAKVSWAKTCSKGTFLAQYRNELKTFSTQPVLTRCETAVNDDWGSGSPGSGVNADSFTSHWVGTFDFGASGYEFTAASDDGIRLWVDGQLLIDQWKDQAAATYKATKAMTAGEHEVKVEYYENAGLAVAKVSWAKTCSKGTFLAQYRNELKTFSTQPVLTRCETAVNDDWGSGSPGSGVNADSFTSHWVGTFDFGASGYEFTAASDDGIRLWVDGQLLIDQWKDQAAATYKATK